MARAHAFRLLDRANVTQSLQKLGPAYFAKGGADQRGRARQSSRFLGLGFDGESNRPQEIGVAMDEHFKTRKSEGLGCVGNQTASRVPASRHEKPAASVEGERANGLRQMRKIRTRE